MSRPSGPSRLSAHGLCIVFPLSLSSPSLSIPLPLRVVLHDRTFDRKFSAAHNVPKDHRTMAMMVRPCAAGGTRRAAIMRSCRAPSNQDHPMTAAMSAAHGSVLAPPTTPQAKEGQQPAAGLLATRPLFCRPFSFVLADGLSGFHLPYAVSPHPLVVEQGASHLRHPAMYRGVLLIVRPAGVVLGRM